MPIRCKVTAFAAQCDRNSSLLSAVAPEMPSGFSAEGEHDVKIYTDAGMDRLRCKCGWERAMTDSELWVEGEPWREIARAHVVGE